MKLHTAGLLVIKKKKLLMAYSNNKNCFYLPGGKVDPAETAGEALCREVEEELNTTILTSELRYYTHITAPAYGEADGVVMEQDCYFVDRPIEPTAAAEVGALHYFSLQEYRLLKNTAPGAIMVLEQLNRDGYID